MSMFCYQCQEAAGNKGCTASGVCGKEETVSILQDALIYTTRGMASLYLKGKENGQLSADLKKEAEGFLVEALFSTITNVNFSQSYFLEMIKKAGEIKKEIQHETGAGNSDLLDAEEWNVSDIELILEKADEVSLLVTENEDLRSLKELLLYGIKGIAAYAHHAAVLGYYDDKVTTFLFRGMQSGLNDSLDAPDYLELLSRCGEIGVSVMALLDKANTETYGDPEPTKVFLGAGTNPGILISGHDLKDLEELLFQTDGTGVDVYTHGEMLPAHYYPSFKKYSHLKGNYGGSWWNQNDEFEKFNGPILMTTNCLVPPNKSYIDRLYTTGTAGFNGVKHIQDRQDGKSKDFSEIITQAKSTLPPEEIETGEIVGGFARKTLLSSADAILAAIKEGSLRKFVVMAGCDGRQKGRNYYSEFAKGLPEDTIILTAGCAKYRYNKLDLGDIGGIPRVVDAGQCNDSYSLVVTAMKLAEVLGVEINELPISYNISWYEQKAVSVLLALLYLGVKNIHLGPTLPAFLSPNVVRTLIDEYGIGGISDVDKDIKTMAGKLIEVK